MSTKLVLGIIAAMVIIIVIKIGGEFNVSTVRDCKVIRLQQQTLMKGETNNLKTEIRYLIVTDKGTFICKNSIIHWKFNNSDIFLRLKEGSTYTF